MPKYNVALWDSYNTPPRLLAVDGQEVAYPELPNVRLFVHKAIDRRTGKPAKGWYQISEYVTGAYVLNYQAQSVDSAIAQFRQHIAEYPSVIEAFPQGIKNYLDRWQPANG
jgi:hypothetical protein